MDRLGKAGISVKSSRKINIDVRAKVRYTNYSN